MKKIIYIIFFTIFCFETYSQYAPDIKAYDIFGNFIYSQQIQSQNKYIFIDFFSNGCATCQTIIPYIDSAYKYFGCNCDDVYFLGINIFLGNDDESVFEFALEYGAEIPLISGESGGAHIADLFDVNYTPFFALISPQNQILILDNFTISNTQNIIDSLEKYGIQQNICKGSEFVYFEAIEDTVGYIAEIDKVNNILTLNLPLNFNISSFSAFIISSSNSKIYFEQNELLNDTVVLNLTDSISFFRIIAEDSSYTDWQLKIQQSLKNIEFNDEDLIYFDETNNLVIKNFDEINNYKLFDLKGRLILKSYPNTEVQNLHFLENGIYIISVEYKTGEIINKKIIKK